MKIVGLLRDSEKSAANRTVRSLLDRFDDVEYVQRTQVAPKDTDLVVQWGFKPTVALLNAIDRGIPYLILDLGYFDQRTTRFSISFNGFHGTAFRDPGVMSLPARLKPKLLPWREGGERVLVIGQMVNDQSLRGQDIDAWMGRAAVEASDAFGLPVHKRPHPKMLNPWEPKPEPLDEALATCAVCITWTSTAAVEAVIKGVPTIAMHPGSSAWPVTAHTIHDGFKYNFEREAWLHELSWREWDFSSPTELDRLAKYITYIYPSVAASKLDSPRNKL